MKLFKVTWRTNYGERVAIVEAESSGLALVLLKDEVWEGSAIEELIVKGYSHVHSIEGGD